ncbi:MAG: hypothetical protein K2M43_00045 [Mycoplasmoidaceae bacterium]|nr:hypothetical protein [Mycoplasmoidaceae bacterium]
MPPIVLSSGPKQKIRKGSIKKLLSYFKNYKTIIIVSLVMSLIAGGLNTVAIYLYGILYDYLGQYMAKAGVSFEIQNFSAFLFTCLGLLISYTICNLFN